MSQLEDMRIFVTVLDARSFTAAAEKLGLSKQYVSRRMMALEARLGVRLLNRSTRRLDVTTLGEAYQQRARQILAEVEALEESIAQQRATPRGSLRLSAPMSFGTLHLSPLIAQFLQRYQEVSIELDLSDRAVDLLGDGYDMAIRIVRSDAMADSMLVARRIAPLDMVTCCSPDYLLTRPAPQTPADLRQLDCLLYGHSRQVEWTYQVDGKPFSLPVSGRLRVNNGELVRDAALGGLGVAYLPTFIVGEALESGALVSLLEDFAVPSTYLHAVYPHHRQASPLIRALVDFLWEAFHPQARPAAG
jgi:DNA-binding transcriptional LysR family regulator